ncbi:MAG: type II toxin-antitoxin system VapC family toxin [Methanocellales archaeon]|nr:type II toxin-antitoxin system VapC family toxin [Methanocellales archaeon]
MRAIIIDASVAVKWFNQEEDTDKALILREEHIDGIKMLCAPTQLTYEVCNTIWKNTQIPDEDAEKAAGALNDLDLNLTQSEKEDLARTMSIAREKDVTFYDASYIQLAEKLGTTLYTADQKQYEAARELVETRLLKEARI